MSTLPWWGRLSPHGIISLWLAIACRNVPRPDISVLSEGDSRTVNRNDSKISLIIPTYNRAASLKRALESALRLDYPPDRYEVIVVDNGCDDASLAVVENAQNHNPGHNISYIREERLGLHNARHAGARAAKGDVLLFTDDDATFSPTWLSAYAQAFDSHPDMAAAGGPVRASWESPPPQWLIEFIGDAKTFGLFSLMEPSSEFRLNGHGVFFGVNMAIRAHVLWETGGFNPEAFGYVWLGDGETGLNYKLWNRGMLIGYVPDAMVYHHIPPERMTLEYLRSRMANQGACDLYSDFHRARPNTPLILRRAFRLLLRNAGRWLTAVVVKNRTDVRSINVQLDAARTQAQLRYMLKIAFDKNLQAFLAKENWLNDYGAVEESAIVQRK